MLDHTKKHFLSFDDAKKTTTSERDLPNTKREPLFTFNGAEEIKPKGQNARMAVQCTSCYKPRVIYASKKLQKQALNDLMAGCQQHSYVCGGSVLDQQHPLSGTVGMHMNITCGSFIEAHYFTSPQQFVCVCIACGESDQEDLVEAPEDIAIKYSSVRPLCKPCIDMGMTFDDEGVWWGRKQLKKRRPTEMESE